MSTDLLELKIITHTESKKIIVEWIDVESPTGNFIVGPDHSPLVSLLKERGKMTYKEHQGGTTTIDTYGGVFSVDESKAIAILDFAATSAHTQAQPHTPDQQQK